MPDECRRFANGQRRFAPRGLRQRRRRRRRRRRPAQHLRDSRACRREGAASAARAGAAQEFAAGGEDRAARMHGAAQSRRDHGEGGVPRRGRGAGQLSPTARDDWQRRLRPLNRCAARSRRDLRRYHARLRRRRARLRDRDARMRQVLRVLRRAVCARPRALDSAGRPDARDWRTGRARRERSRAARADRQCLPLRRHRLRRAAQDDRDDRRDRADSLHVAASERHERVDHRRDGDRAESPAASASADAVGLRQNPRRDGARLHGRANISTWSRACARQFPASRYRRT